MKPRFTPGQHAACAAELYEIRARLITLCNDIGRAYPHNHRFARAAEQALRAVDEARNRGDSALAVEHPGAFTPRTYYPRTDQEIA
jgi:hypothetical protein